jgi:ABC-2 type transport system ATP-binding protein
MSGRGLIKEYPMGILLRLERITKIYQTPQGPIESLKGVSLDIMRGEVLSLLGVNGAGKTTLSSIIATLHPATSGDILKNGVSIYSNVVGYRRTIGFCPQKPNVDMMLTLEENLMFAGRFFCLPDGLIRERIEILLDQFGLRKYAQQKADVLSGGYKQRFMLARTLIHKPELVILDEPTVGLDPQVRRDIWEVIKQLRATGVTVLLTTHYLDEADELSDRVCVLDRGVIQLVDSPQNLKELHGKQSLEEVFIKLMHESEHNHV